jgi:hypothetical protein
MKREESGMTESVAAARHRLSGLLVLAVCANLMLTMPSWGQVRSSMSDTARGVTFHSIEVSDDRIHDLEVLDGTFSSGDRLVVGLSTMVFDGSGEISSHIFWIRHEGRRWLDYGGATPVAIIADDREVPLESLRSPQPFVGTGGGMIEKLEFLVDSANLERLLSADRITVQLRSETGDIDKTLSSHEIQQLREFLTTIGAST